MVRPEYIIAIWDEGRYTGMSIDGPPYQATVKLAYEQTKIALEAVAVKVIE
jgi:hypothetical protein